MTQADFYDWKRHPVTQQVFSQLQDRLDQIKEQLVYQAVTADPRVLAERAGMAQAFKFFLDIDYEESHSD